MQVSYPNNVKIYNLSAGKSLPEWLSERKRRSLSKKNVDIRRRIELIQDFDMPGLSTSVRVSKDGQYILATGIYKPRVKCFDVNNLSLKFERCFDSEVITFQTLSDDYSKLVFLHCDRNIEFHAAHGKYYKLRIPRFGRDMQYHYPSCDLYVVGDSNEIYRINLERGQFLQSFSTDASSLNKCQVNPEHHLLVVGTQEGKVEAWDPRAKTKVGTLDCALHCISGENEKIDAIPSITALKFQGGLTLAVGTTTGNVLLYDVRSNKPMLVKDHMYGLPIKNIEFHSKMNMVYSMDSSVVKIWSRDSGKPYTSIEAPQYADYNDLCVVPDTGMLFVATENVKIQTYYIPSLGPAPHWCSFLDNLTEELEELNYETVYDDYKFITGKELDELGLTHLRGTNLLRAYMHGYFMDIRLYRKARDAIKPFEFDEYKKNKIREKIQEDRGSRVQVQKLPPVNKELALKLIDEESRATSKKKKSATNLLQDKRFKDLFTNPDFQVDKTSEEYTLLNPVVSHLDKSRAKTLKAQSVDVGKVDVVDENEDCESSGDERLLRDTSSSDDEKTWVREVRKQYKHIRRRNEIEMANEDEDNSDASEKRRHPRLYAIKEDTDFRGAKPVMKKCDRATLGERLQNEGPHVIAVTGSRGNKEMTFTTGKQRHSHLKDSQHTRKGRRHTGHLLRPARNTRKLKR